MNLFHVVDQKKYPSFFIEGEELKLQPRSEDQTFTISMGHIVRYQAKNFYDSKVRKSRDLINRLLQDYSETWDEQAKDRPCSKIIFSNKEDDSLFCEMDYGKDTDNLLYINSKLPELDEPQIQGAIALYSVFEILKALDLKEEDSFVLKCSSETEYAGILKLVGAPQEDIAYTETLDLSQLNNTVKGTICPFGKKLLDYLNYRDIDDNAMVEVTDAIRLTNRLRAKSGLIPFAFRDLRDYFGLSDKLLGKGLLDAGYRVVSPMQSEDTWKAFRDLFPANIDRTNHHNLMLGIVNGENYAIGAMSVDETAEDYHMNWLYVAPSERRKGVASLLLQTFVNFISESEDLKGISAELRETDVALKQFFESQFNFDLEDYLQEYEITTSQKQKNPLLEKVLITANDLLKYSKLSKERQADFEDTMRSSGVVSIQDPNWKDSMVNDLCLCRIKEERIQGEVVVTRVSEKENELSFLYSKNPATTVELISAVYNGLQDHFPDCALRVTPVNEISDKMLHKLAGDSLASTKVYKCNWNFN